MEKERWGNNHEDKRNWREYNEKLVARGEAYIALDFIDSWIEDVERLNRGKVGAPYDYPDCLMVFLAYLHVLLNIDYRGLEGFLRGLAKLIRFAVPDYATICRRVNRVSIEVKKTLIPFEGKEVVISLDSSGVKVTNRGEWMRQKWKVRRGWIKVHISVDDQNKQVVGIEATDESVSDTDEFVSLVEQSVGNVEAAGGKVVQANGDGAYDANDNFTVLESHGITPAIKIRENAGPTCRSKNPRKDYAREFRELGFERWRGKYKYGKRWYSEGTFSAVKRKFGEWVRAIKAKNMFNEVKLKYLFYNALLKYAETRESIFVTLIQ